MAAIDPDKKLIVDMVKQWRGRSGQSVDDLVARMHRFGCDITRTVFENRFTTHLSLKPNAPPEAVLALIEAMTKGLLPRERATAAEALEFARLTQLPFDWLYRLEQLFPHAEFRAAYSHYQPEVAVAGPDQPLQRKALTSFIGRGQELAEIGKLLSESRLLVLVGVGGCGKTRLAFEIASGMPATIETCFVRLEDLTNELQVQQAIASAAGLLSGDDSALLGKLVLHWRSRDVVLVLDNCEHVSDPCVRISTFLLEQCPRLRILATSRDMLHAPYETVWSVPPLTTPSSADLELEPAQALDVLSSYDSVRLFITRATTALRSFHLSEANVLSVGRLCHSVDGIPLAIELAAAQIRRHTLSEMERSLGNLLLSADQKTKTQAAHRHQTIQTTLLWSIDRLSDAEQAVLYRASVFRGGFSQRALDWLCGGQTGLAEGVTPIVLQLIDRSLLEVHDHLTSRRFHMLEVVRQFAADQFHKGSVQVLEQACLAHATYFLELAEAARLAIRHTADPGWMSQIEHEHDNLRAALAWVNAADANADDTIALRLVNAVWPFWQVAGLRVEGLNWLRATLAAHRGAPPALRAEVLRGACALSFDLGDYSTAESFAQEALLLASDLNDKRGVAFSLVDLAAIAKFLYNDSVQARAHLDESLRLFRETAEAYGLALVLTRIGNLEHARGDHAAALGFLKDSLRRQRLLGSTWLMAVTLRNLGMVTCDQGDYARSVEYYEAARDLYAHMRDPISHARLSLGLGRVLMCQGKLLQAQSSFSEALNTVRKRVDRWGTAQALNGLGDVARFLDDPNTAIAYFEEGLAIQREIGSDQMIAWFCSNLGYVYCATHDFRQSFALMREALDLRQGTDDVVSRVDSIEGIATLAAYAGSAGPAARLFGATKALRVQFAMTPSIPESLELERTLQRTRSQLSADMFDAAMRAGSSLDLNRAFQEAEYLCRALIRLG